MRNNYLSVILAFAFVINENGKKKSILNVCFLHNISQVHNGKLNDPYCSPNIVWVIKSRIMRWVGHVAHMWGKRGIYGLLVGKPDERRPFGRPRRRWVDNIKMDLQEVGCGGMDWIKLAQDRDRWRVLANALMNLWVP